MSTYVSQVISVKQSDGSFRDRTFKFDTPEIAQYALTRGMWEEQMNKSRTHPQLRFWPSAEFPLIWEGESIDSFLPYVGLRHYTKRSQPLNQFDYRKQNFKNFKQRAVDIAMYQPSVKDQVVPETLLQEPVVAVASRVDIDIAGATLAFVMSLFKCSSHDACDHILNNIPKQQAVQSK